jgi:hypothetical protein
MRNLRPDYDNENKKNHISIRRPTDEGSSLATVYLDYHQGRHDHKSFLDNKKRSIFYKERLLQQQHDLGLDRDPDHLKASVLKRDFKKIETVDEHFQEAHKI